MTLSLFSPKALRRAVGMEEAATAAGNNGTATATASATSHATAGAIPHAPMKLLEKPLDEPPRQPLDAKPLDYILTVLVDVRRLPLPSFCDPFTIRWHTRAAGVYGERAASLWAPKEEIARCERAEAVLKHILSLDVSLSASLLAQLSGFEHAVGTARVSGKELAGDRTQASIAAGWHVVAEALYPLEGARGFLRFKKAADEGARLAHKASKNTNIRKLVSSYGG